VVNGYASWLGWQGYLMGLFGGKDGTWAYANLGVVVALVIGFAGTWIFRRTAVRAQEDRPASVLVES
jgi:hypothetical protein